jgi:hypothetical protein
MGQTLSRFILFLFAYIPIYFIVAFKSINPGIFSTDGSAKPLKEVVKLNAIPVLLIGLVIMLLLFFAIFQRIALRASGNPRFTIKSIGSQNKEYITYLGTYILPFVALETKTIFDVIAYVFLFLTMGYIYSKTTLVFTNPMLMFFGYELYEVTDTTDRKYVCIIKAKVKLKASDKPIGIKLGENTYLLSKWKKEN